MASVADRLYRLAGDVGTNEAPGPGAGAGACRICLLPWTLPAEQSTHIPGAQIPMLICSFGSSNLSGNSLDDSNQAIPT